MKILKSYLLIVLLLNITSWVSATSLFSSVKTSKGENLQKEETYKARDALYALDDPSVNRATSEHFQIIWGNNDTTGTVNLKLAEGNLKNLENIRSCYLNLFGLGDITTSLNESITGLYKSNLYIAFTGLEKIGDDWAYVWGDPESFAFQVMMSGALRVDPPSWVPPHELGHVFMGHNRGWFPFHWGESIANFLRNEYLMSDYNSFGGVVYAPQADFFPAYLLTRELHFPHDKNYYDIWPILLYVNENPENIPGLGTQTLVKIFTDQVQDSSYFHKFEKISGVSIKEILGRTTRRLITMDFKAKKQFLKSYDDFLKVPGHLQKTYTTLTNATDGWMVVPGDRAPQQAGHNVIPLGSFPNKSSITVNFQGTSTATGADWRVSIVTATADRTSRYSSMWNSGTNTMNLQGNEKGVYLVVTATPDTMLQLDTDKDGVKFPYKIQVTSQ